MFAAGSFMIGFFSAIPAYVAVRSIRQSTERNNAERAMSELSAKIDAWNRCLFRPHGISVHIDLPAAQERIGADDVHDVYVGAESERELRGKDCFKARMVITPLKQG